MTTLFHAPIQPKYGDDTIKLRYLLTTLKALFSLGAVRLPIAAPKDVSCPLFLKDSQKQGFQKQRRSHNRVAARLYIWEWSEREGDVMKLYL